MITVSLVFLTYNRKETALRALGANLASAGYPVKEIIHVDNGSREVFSFPADVRITHARNQGVAKGYNRGMLLATSSHIVITGCDRIMPFHWLKRFVEATKAIPETGVISCYSQPAKTKDYSARFRAPEEILNGVKIRRAMPCEARMHSREFLLEAGFFREDFGLYGFEDVEWVERAERVARETGRINYVLPDLGLAAHIADDHLVEYEQFKHQENSDPRKKALALKCWESGSPYYNPYSRIEKPLE